jgi:hypothetical protein
MPRSFYNGPNPVVDPIYNTNIIIRGFNALNTSSPTTNDGTALRVPVGTQNYANISSFVDVIPLRDYWWLYGEVAGVPQGSFQTPPWEVDVNFDPALDYGNNPAQNPSLIGNPFQTNDLSNPQLNARYACAWHDDMPALIRILIKVDDPNNRVKDGPWYEYIFKLK